MTVTIYITDKKRKTFPSSSVREKRSLQSEHCVCIFTLAKESIRGIKCIFVQSYAEFYFMHNYHSDHNKPNFDPLVTAIEH